MRLYRKLLLFTLLAAVLPLSAVGFYQLAAAERALRARIEEHQLASARAAAELVGHDLRVLIEDLGVATRTWSPASLGADELRGFLTVVLNTSPRIRASLLVGERGELPVAPVTGSQPGVDPPRPPLSPDALDAFRRLLPVETALEADGFPVVVPVYLAPSGQALLTVAQAVEGRGGGSWVLGVLVDLEEARRRVAAAAAPQGAAALLDEDARPVVVSPETAFGPEDLAAAQRLRAATPGGGTGDVPGAPGGVLAAWAPVPGDLGWSVLVRLPARVAFAEVARMRREVLVASLGTLAALLLLGGLFVRGITRGLARIDAAAREIGRGNLSVRLPGGGDDEVGQVSRAFNQMGEELEAARSRLTRWNEELREQVEARTRELREAQARLIESQKLTAIGQLGAGVAHEINNPLTGILGQAQLLLEQKRPEDPEVSPLRQIEQLARRSRDITINLLRFSHHKEEPELASVDLNAVVRDAMLLAERQIREDGVALEMALETGLPPVRGDAGQLAHVLLNLLSNARTACRGLRDPRIEVRTGAADGEVRLRVSDTGRGIAPEIRPRIFEPFFTTKDVWSNVGLGLSVSWRIVAAHGGRIDVDSRPGEGSTFTVILPAVPAGV